MERVRRSVRDWLATGDVILIKDGDLEYDPNDYLSLLGPIVSARQTLSMAHVFSVSRKECGGATGLRISS